MTSGLVGAMELSGMSNRAQMLNYWSRNLSPPVVMIAICYTCPYPPPPSFSDCRTYTYTCPDLTRAHELLRTERHVTACLHAEHRRVCLGDYSGYDRLTYTSTVNRRLLKAARAERAVGRRGEGSGEGSGGTMLPILRGMAPHTCKVSRRPGLLSLLLSPPYPLSPLPLP